MGKYCFGVINVKTPLSFCYWRSTHQGGWRLEGKTGGMHTKERGAILPPTTDPQTIAPESNNNALTHPRTDRQPSMRSGTERTGEATDMPRAPRPPWGYEGVPPLLRRAGGGEESAQNLPAVAKSPPTPAWYRCEAKGVHSSGLHWVKTGSFARKNTSQFPLNTQKPVSARFMFRTTTP